ncbi:S-layer homology domain-containing protein [Paenibacillus sp. GD4]|uniref:S-layer homology domain-containing protein n=1 Tax=Paenibacillus sp. GD4 TaxID=3068890 RepID=UPI00279644B8|nr:S-layer homology domain-containing protein [Paenibacillus sp. GD4]MDQ1911819.1 S-layer homology domain-containing protein [Paenibacillus sp. GD4]
MKKTINTLAVLTLSAGLMGLSGTPVKADPLSFSDVPPQFWGYAPIQWAVDRKVVDGYPDGTFHPNQAVTQNDFLAMLIRAYQPDDFRPNPQEKDWALPYLQYGTQLGWGLAWTPSQGNPPITRGTVARIITNASGKNYTLDDSVQYLLDTGLSDGKTAKTPEGYQKNDTLTRTEALTFVQRMREKVPDLQPKPNEEQKYSAALVEAPAIHAVPINEYINLIQNTEIYSLPSKEAPSLAVIAPQSVHAFEKADNWYHIHSPWLGDSWIYADSQAARPDTDGYGAPAFVPLTEIKGQWAFEHQYEQVSFNIVYSIGDHISPNLTYPRVDGAPAGEPVPFSLSLINRDPNTVATVTGHDFEIQIFRHQELVWRGKVPEATRIPLNTLAAMGIDFSWDQKDANGTPVPPGTYSVYLQTPASIQYQVEGKEGSLIQPIDHVADKTLGGTFTIR